MIYDIIIMYLELMVINLKRYYKFYKKYYEEKKMEEFLKSIKKGRKRK